MKSMDREQYSRVWRATVYDPATGETRTLDMKGAGRDLVTGALQVYPGERVTIRLLPWWAVLVGGGPVGRRRGISARDLYFLVDSLGDALSAGISLDRALRRALPRMTCLETRGVLARVICCINREGMSLGQSLSRVGWFPESFVAMVEAGEASGRLPEILGTYATRLGTRRKITRKLIAGAIYPTLLLLLTLLSMLVLGLWILPQVEEVFGDAGYDLPVATRFLLDLASEASKPWWIPVWLVLLPCVVGWMVRKFWRSGRGYRVLGRLPQVGILLSGSQLLRPLQTLSLLVGAGRPLVESLRMAGRVSSHPAVTQYFNALSRRLVSGQSLERALRLERGKIPEGEEISLALGGVTDTGRLATPLERWLRNLEENLDTRSEVLPKLVEPVMLSLVFGMVIVVVVAAVFPGIEFLRQTLTEM